MLQLQEEYVVGIGGACNPINEWSTVASYSSSELNLMTQLASGCKGDCTSNQVPGNLQLSISLCTQFAILLSSIIAVMNDNPVQFD